MICPGRVPYSLRVIDMHLCEQSIPSAPSFPLPSSALTKRKEEELKVVQRALEFLVEFDRAVLFPEYIGNK